MDRRDKMGVLGSPLQWLLAAVAAGLVCGCAAVAADGLVREGWQQVDVQRHLGAGCAMYGAVGAVAGLILWIYGWAAVTFERELRPHLGRASFLVVPSSVAVLAVIGLRTTALWTFSGGSIQSSSVARWGPYLFLAGSATGLALAAACARHALLKISERRWVTPAVIAGGLVATGCLLAAIDLTVLVALYSRLHEMLEILAALLVMSGLAIAFLLLGAQRPWLAQGFRAVGVGGLCWLVTFAASAETRLEIDVGLRHVWQEPGYLGRMLMRKQLAEAYLEDPTAWQGARASRMVRLRQHYDISTTALGRQWNEPPTEPAALTTKLKELRQAAKDYNIVVFYVDALRSDVAHDPAKMPNTVAFARRSLDFRRAYSFASDTVTSLPVLTGGSYFPDSQRPDLVKLAHGQSVASALFIPLSARRFLTSQLPAFSFEETVEFRDYRREKKVWGYGADLSSAGGLVDETLDWIDRRSTERFFAWIFHYDVHNWRELEATEEEDSSDAGLDGVDHEERRRRYYSAATGVDLAFGRFLEGLEHRGLADRTIVLVVADHGEALGRQGHWVHAVFLWESLVNTPLILHVPGIQPAVVDTPVSHADVLPTLARYLDTDADVASYHGYDLLRHTLADAPTPDLPVLLLSMRKKDVLRVGLIERRAPFHKLVLPLDSVEPELHDLTLPEPDDFNYARQRPMVMLRMLSQLVRSPVFPRSDDERQDGLPARPKVAATRR